MKGNTLTRSAHAIYHLARHPVYAARWLHNFWTDQSPISQQLPWISWPAIEYLQGFAKPGMEVFEYGAGGSTLFWLSKGAKVYSVENSQQWGEAVKEAAGVSKMLELETVEMEERPENFQEQEKLDRYLNSIQRGGPYDVVLVDGVDGAIKYRVTCAVEAVKHLKPGGIIVLDDSWRDAYSELPKLLDGFNRKEFWGLGPSRLGVTKTDIYYR